MGNGMIVQRGLRPPPSFHDEKMRNQPAGYYFDVITNGFGAMQDYRAQVDVKDRWAIISYIRALQYSQRATLADVPEDKRGELDAPETERAPGHGARHARRALSDDCIHLRRAVARLEPAAPRADRGRRRSRAVRGRVLGRPRAVLPRLAHRVPVLVGRLARLARLDDDRTTCPAGSGAW